MTKTKCTFSVLAVFLFIIACATRGQATAQRTFVAGPGIGNDTNTASDCSFSAPCRFFSAAFGVTSTGGEIIALSPGVGYGGLTIDRAVTITGLPGQVAFVAVSASTAGFVVNAGASDLVVVRNITFNGSGAANSTGLSHNGGKLVVENCIFTQLSTGISVVNAKMDLRDSNLTGNSVGASVAGTGTNLAMPATALLTIHGGSVTFNSTAFFMTNPGSGLYNIYIHAGDSPTDWFTTVMGNTNVVSGTGTGCPCVDVGSFRATQNPN